MGEYFARSPEAQATPLMGMLTLEQAKKLGRNPAESPEEGWLIFAGRG